MPRPIGDRAQGCALGSGAATNSLADIEGAEVLIVSGSNTTEAHPVAALKIKKSCAVSWGEVDRNRPARR